METNKIMSSGVVAKFATVVKTEMDYNNKSSKATVYYYLDEAPQTHKTVNIFFDNNFPGKIEKTSL